MSLLLATIACACGAAPNPAPPSAPAPFEAEASLRASPSAREAAQDASPPPTSAAGARPAAQSPAKATEQAAAPASTPAAAAPAAGAGTRAAATGPELVIAHVAGKAIDVRELLAQWLHRDSVEVLEQIDHLVIDRLVGAEATRLGIRVDDAAGEAAYVRAVAALESEIGKKRPGVSLDQYVDKMLGLDPLVYRERLREDALRGLLAERVMRSFVLSSEHALIRVVVVKTAEKVKEVEAVLAAGEAFEDVARRLSSDASAQAGGRVAPVVRADTVMGRLAFDTAVGTVGGPTFEQGAWLFVKVEERPEPLKGSWSELAPAVEKSLAERGIENIEMQQWESAMGRRYEIDIEPFLRLAGQTRK